MIKLFNKVRKNALSESRLGKYLLYALGEIILVVIGILIALKINNYNIQQNNNTQEVKILLQLKEEFKTNLKELEGKISMRIDIMYASEKMIQLFDSGINDTPLDTLAKYNYQIIMTPTFNPSTGVTNELINSGKLYLIKNEYLKTALSNWSGDIEKLIEMELTLYNMIARNYTPYLLENYRRRNLMDHTLVEEFRKKFMLSDIKEPNYYGTLNRSEFEKYYEDSIMESYITLIGEFAYYGNRQSEGIKNRINSILDIIDAELKKNN